MQPPRICVVGAGRWGHNHIRTLAGLGHLAGVVDRDRSMLESIRSDYPDIELFEHLGQALEASFDGFTVATPSETHAATAREILKAGKPVLVEKPLALSSVEARELCRLAEARGVGLMVGHVLLFHPAVRRIKELIDSGKIGRLEYLYSNRLNLGTVRTEENILWSFAPHDVSIFEMLTGAMPEEVVSRGAAFLQPGIHDSTMTVLTYPGNVIGHIFVSWLHPFKEHRLVVIGSRGMLSYEDSSEAKELLFYEKGIDWVKGEPIKREGPTEIVPYERSLPLTEELRYFAGNLGGAMEICDGESAVRVLEVLEMASRSLLEGEPVRAGAVSAPAPAGAGFFVHPTSVVDENVTIGEGTKIWHFSHVQSGSTIGSGCTLGQNVNVGNNVSIGNHVKIQNNVSVYEGVTLEDYVFCGPSMVFTNILDPRSKYPQRGASFYIHTLVGEGATLGANCTIVCGNRIGRHAFVAAGAVVTREVPDFALVAGVPACRIGWACECGEVLPAFESSSMTCPRCGKRYSLDEKQDRLTQDV